MNDGSESVGADLVISTFKASADIRDTMTIGLRALVNSLPVEAGIVCLAIGDQLVVMEEFNKKHPNVERVERAVDTFGSMLILANFISMNIPAFIELTKDKSTEEKWNSYFYLCGESAPIRHYIIPFCTNGLVQGFLSVQMSQETDLTQQQRHVIESTGNAIGILHYFTNEQFNLSCKIEDLEKRGHKGQ